MILFLFRCCCRFFFIVFFSLFYFIFTCYNFTWLIVVFYTLCACIIWINVKQSANSLSTLLIFLFFFFVVFIQNNQPFCVTVLLHFFFLDVSIDNRCSVGDSFYVNISLIFIFWEFWLFFETVLLNRIRMRIQFITLSIK